MSDTTVTVAPPGGAAQASSSTTPGAAPSSNEVAINHPVSTPNPVGSQAPSAAEGTPSRREALQKAFDRAQSPPPKPERHAPKPEPKAAEAKPGHNNPPEETPKLDLKKRPDDQPQRERGEGGRFAPREKDESQVGIVGHAQNSLDMPNDAQPAKPYKRLPSHAPFAEPPTRMDERGKRDWAETPESVRGSIHRMHHEFGQAYQQYRGDHEAMNSIRPYHQMAQQHGTTLDKALGNYVSMEQKLRSDPLGGLDLIINNLGLTDPQTGRRLGARDWAYTILSQSPEQLRMMQQGNQQNASSHQIGALHQRQAALEQHIQQMHTQQQFVYTRSAVDQFALTHPRIDEEVFGKTVEQELRFGFDLEQAYQRAEALHPATHAAQTRTASAQTRPTDRSIHGNPDVAPSNGASRRPKEPSPTPRAALENAMNRVQGRACLNRGF